MAVVVSKKKPSISMKVHHRTKHGFCKSKTGVVHPIYISWAAMKTRCLNPNYPHYKYYGGRGISICKRWMDFKNFKDDMFSTWRDGLELDRKDVNGDYKPSNCRWANRMEQMSNSRRNHFIEHNGQRKTLAQWSRHLGGGRSLVTCRLQLGMDEITAVTMPVKPSGPRGKR